MSLTLKEFMKVVEGLKKKKLKTPDKNIAEELLGKYEGIAPQDKNSSSYIRELRSSLYGKIKDTNGQ